MARRLVSGYGIRCAGNVNINRRCRMMKKSINQAYEDLLLKSWDNAEEQIRVVIFKTRKVNMLNEPRYHSRVNHDYWEGKLGFCPYCKEGCLIKEEENGPTA
jgi:hypothetical protein